MIPLLLPYVTLEEFVLVLLCIMFMCLIIVLAKFLPNCGGILGDFYSRCSLLSGLEFVAYLWMCGLFIL